jgi:predicted regulator of Ras-like GTPase activity (Roadblock/LC7/MglB family)
LKNGRKAAADPTNPDFLSAGPEREIDKRDPVRARHSDRRASRPAGGRSRRREEPFAKVRDRGHEEHEGEKMQQESGLTKINRMLAELNESGGFPISVLTDSQGLTIAFAADDGTDPERHSAVVAYLQKAVLQVSRQLGMAGAEEISFFDSGGRRLVCRMFRMGDHELILAIMSPARDHSYRRATNHAVSQIRKIWEQFWK